MDDSTLEVRTAIDTVESSLDEVGQRMSLLTQQWEAWHQHVLTSKQFKSQWHQFIQDARRVQWQHTYLPFPSLDIEQLYHIQSDFSVRGLESSGQQLNSCISFS